MVDLTNKETHKQRVMEKDNYDKLVALKERMTPIKGVDLYDQVRAMKMCLVPNIIVQKKLGF